MNNLIKTKKPGFSRDKFSKSLINIDNNLFELAKKQKEMVLKKKKEDDNRLTKIEENILLLNNKIDILLKTLSHDKT